MYLSRLIYVSTLSEGFNQSLLENILDVSRRNNSKNKLTGMLCFHQKFFLQCLEGPRANVNSTYNRILNDKRHENAHILDFQEIDERVFASWAMAYVPSSSLTESLNLKFSGSNHFNPYDISGKSAFKLMLELNNSLVKL
ncbi:BLUF domain-containing protein [Paraglaciecola sp. 25GB23A]|uniref:BLUF domain-containing protein n=1 Tax=Paraglaciecola sp. 25GB23A TaxID=3156068 RepID=UPI0032AFAA1B